MARKTGTWVTNLTVVGLQFRWKKSGRDMLRKGAPFGVAIVRELDNPHDPNACAVMLKSDRKFAALDGRQLGYLRKEAAAVLAPRLDNGSVEAVYGICHEIDADGENADCEFRFRDVKTPVSKPKTRVSKKDLTR